MSIIDDARRIRLSSIPPWPVMLFNPMTCIIAPAMITEISIPENLVSTPIKMNIPGINSANAIGICISTGNPIIGKKLVNEGSNFSMPCKMKIVPKVNRNIKNPISL